MGRDRLPDDRLRGAAVPARDPRGDGPLGRGVRGLGFGGALGAIDPWLVQAVLAGFPARDRAEPMFEWARAQMRAGRTPDFSLPPWEELRQAFEALVYRAVVQGDSAETRRAARAHRPGAPAAPSEPAADALRWSLRARLALLARDTTAAIDGAASLGGAHLRSRTRPTIR